MNEGAMGLPEVGDRVELVYTDDEHTRLEPGDLGTVTRVTRHPSGSHVVSVTWDTGSALMLLSDVDQWRVVAPKLRTVE